jgi:DNA-directed RNA polymerase specialized sigma24 family protein
MSIFLHILAKMAGRGHTHFHGGMSMMDSNTTVDLMTLVAAADQADDEAFATLYSRLRGIGWRRFHAVRTMYSEAEWEQEVLILLMKCVRQYRADSGSGFAHYFKVAVHNFTLTVRTRGWQLEKRRLAELDRLEYEEVEKAESSSSVRGRGSSTELWQLVVEEVALFAPRTQTSFWLHAGGYQLAEIADVVGISQRTVRRDVSQATLAVRTLMLTYR